MPQGHHHHENKRDITETRALQKMRRERENGVLLEDKPMPLIDIGIDEIARIIKSITENNEDAFQEAWVKVLTEHPKSEKDIQEYARQALKETHVHEYQEISLQKPIGEDLKTDKPRTVEDVIVSHELILDNPEEIHSRRKYSKNHLYSSEYRRKHGLDDEVIKALFARYPNETLNTALRMLLNLPVKPTKYWKQAEIDYLKKHYPDTHNDNISVYLGRSVQSIRNKAAELKLIKIQRGRVVPPGSYCREEVMKILHCSGKYYDQLIKMKYISGRMYKNARIIFHDDLVKFLKQHPFVYRHDLIESPWAHYVPNNLKSWLPIDKVAETLHWSSDKIRRTIKSDNIPIKKTIGGGSKPAVFLRIEDIRSNLCDEPQPYKVALMGDCTHYVKWQGDQLIRMCYPKQKGLPRIAIEKFAYYPFRHGKPTCHVCLEKLRKGKI
jgi:hypothetical protein